MDEISSTAADCVENYPTNTGSSDVFPFNNPYYGVEFQESNQSRENSITNFENVQITQNPYYE